jgi:hypothetical protein
MSNQGASQSRRPAGHRHRAGEGQRDCPCRRGDLRQGGGGESIKRFLATHKLPPPLMASSPGDRPTRGRSFRRAPRPTPKAKPLVRLSDNYLLRLDFPCFGQIRQGRAYWARTVTVRVESFGDKTFTGKITRFTDEVNDATRTMITEIEVKNPGPGNCAGHVRHGGPESGTSFSACWPFPPRRLPARKQSTVDVVNPDNQIEERRDYPWIGNAQIVTTKSFPD